MDISSLFDAAWYLHCNPDVAAAGVDPLSHFIDCGAAEGRDPCALFDTDWYVARYPEARREGVNPVEHYLAHDRSANPHPLFETRWYLEKNRDIGPGINLLGHYRACDPNQLRSPHPLFDARWYLAFNGDVAAARVNPLEHFLNFGNREGRNPNPFFDVNWYFARYPDLSRYDTNALIHYVLHGAREGRDPSGEFDTRWYLNQNPEIERQNKNPLAHYIHVGRSKGRPAYNRDRRVLAEKSLATCLPALARLDPALAAIRMPQDLQFAERQSGHAFGAAYSAWKALLKTIKRPFSHIIFISGEALPDNLQLTRDIWGAALGRSEPESTLFVVTGAQSPALQNNLDGAEVRVFSDLNPKLSETDRAKIITTMIHFLRPRAMLNVDSSPADLALAERAPAMHHATRLFVTAIGAPAASAADRKARLDRMLPYLSGIYAAPGSGLALSKGGAAAPGGGRVFDSATELLGAFLTDGDAGLRGHAPPINAMAIEGQT